VGRRGDAGIANAGLIVGANGIVAVDALGGRLSTY
jgi:hypothetical protein